MKKIISLLLALTMCISLCLALGSCQIIEKYIPGLKKEENNEPETTYTVTQEQWDAAMAQKNFSAAGNTDSFVDQKINYGGQEQHNQNHQKSTFEQKYTESSKYYWSKNTNDWGTSQESVSENSGYSVLLDGIWYYLVQDTEDEPWDAFESYEQEPDQTVQSQILGEQFNFTFSDFTYNADKKAYELNKKLDEGFMLGGVPNSNPDSNISLTIWFENGNVVKADVSLTENLNTSGEGYTIVAEVVVTGTIVISNHGTTVIELPEYEINK